MTAKIKSEQPALFWAFLGLMILFLFLHLGTEFMVQIGITKTQVGGDVCKIAFMQCWAIALMVANAGARKLAGDLSTPLPAAEPPSAEVVK